MDQNRLMRVFVFTNILPGCGIHPFGTLGLSKTLTLETVSCG